MKTSRVGQGRRRIIRGQSKQSTVSYICKAGSGEHLAEVCLIFEVLDCCYCLVRELRDSSLDEIIAATSRYNDQSYAVRPAHTVMSETFKIFQRSGVSLLLELSDIRQTEQVAWLGILGNEELTKFAIQNRFVNSSLFSSSVL